MLELSAASWLSIVHREYLEGFIPAGGAAVKFVVPQPPLTSQQMRDSLREAAEAHGFQFAFVDSRLARIHLIDRLFHDVARQVDWDDLAHEYLIGLLSKQGYRLPPPRIQFNLSALAESNERQEASLRQDIRREIEQGVFRDYEMSQEFRLAMIGLCRSQLDPGYEPVSSAIRDWLLGDPVRLSSLKPALIFQRVARHNARHMLISLSHWVKLAGKKGLLLVLDVTRYAQAVHPFKRGEENSYGTAAALDMYEVLRQLVDSTDDMESMFIAVIAGPEFLTDERRGVRGYHALYLRIADEVHDQYRVNPLASLVRLQQPSSPDLSGRERRSAAMTSTPPSGGYVTDRRAIEALRSGVPNRNAVRALGCAQPNIEQAFSDLLASTTDGVASESQAPGLLVSGDFGSGKSHLLEYLTHVALEQRFVCSKIVISKETPLFDPAKLYRAAIRAAVTPDRKGAVVTEVASSLDFNSTSYTDFYKWVNRPNVGLNSRFPATVFLYEREKDPEVADRVISFWSGDPLGVAPLRAWLRAHGEAGSYRLEKVSTKDLWLQRFRFAARLIVAAGYRGWVLLVDEVELIGRYSFKQRARSYAELARWAARLQGETCPGLATVFAITSDFSVAVLADRNDKDAVPGRLRASGIEADHLLASQAERGMRLIDQEALRLRPPASAAIDETRGEIREIHARAYSWSPPQPAPEERLTTTLMRQYVRRWISEWDLKRLYPEHDVHMVVEEIKMDYTEDHELELPAADEGGETAAG